MHGSIFTELNKFADGKFGAGTWNKLLDDAGLHGTTFDPLGSYPDANALAIVGAASRATGLSAAAVLEAFGEFIAPDLIEMFWGAIDPAWKTLDLLEHTEQTIHTLVRVQTKSATPPTLRATRTAPNEVVMLYSSARRMCSLAKGLARGVSSHYGERLSIGETECMERGDPHCRFVFRTEG